MIEEVGKVISVEGTVVTVETQIKSTCGSCQAQSNCGTGVIAKTLTPRTETLQFESTLPLKVGSRVRLGIPEEALLKASMLLYVIPLLALVLAASVYSVLLPQFGFTHELWLIAATLVTALATFVGLSGWIKKQEHQQYQPRLIGVLLEQSSNSATLDYR